METKIEVSPQVWTSLTAGRGFPPSLEAASKAGYQPFRPKPPQGEGKLIEEFLPTMTVLVNPTAGVDGPCGVTFDATGNPIPVYPDPHTGLCNMGVTLTLG